MARPRPRHAGRKDPPEASGRLDLAFQHPDLREMCVVQATCPCTPGQDKHRGRFGANAQPASHICVRVGGIALRLRGSSRANESGKNKQKPDTHKCFIKDSSPHTPKKLYMCVYTYIS